MKKPVPVVDLNLTDGEDGFCVGFYLNEKRVPRQVSFRINESYSKPGVLEGFTMFDVRDLIKIAYRRGCEDTEEYFEKNEKQKAAGK